MLKREAYLAKIDFFACGFRNYGGGKGFGFNSFENFGNLQRNNNDLIGKTRNLYGNVVGQLENAEGLIENIYDILGKTKDFNVNLYRNA